MAWVQSNQRTTSARGGRSALLRRWRHRAPLVARISGQPISRHLRAGDGSVPV